MNYFTLEDTKEILNTFTSWIGKKASLGNGTTETLKAIEVKEGRVKNLSDPERKYRINFRFENKMKFKAREFLKANGLERLYSSLPSRRNTAA